VSADAADEMLLADIKAFVGRLESGAYVEGWGWDEDLHDERSFGDGSWADEMDDLLGGAESAFLDGDLDLAGIAYEPLLKAFERHADGFCGAEEPERMLSTDVGEVRARYLRAVYETTRLSVHADTLLEEMGALRYIGGPLSPRPVIDARRAALPDLETFLPSWIERLGSGINGDSPVEVPVALPAITRREAAAVAAPPQNSRLQSGRALEATPWAPMRRGTPDPASLQPRSAQVRRFELPIRCAQHQLREERIIVLASSSGGGAAATLLVVIVGIGLYFLPTIIAVARKVTNQGSVLVINFFLGWTFIGWVVALAMACRTSNLSAR
jgi:hypothetical protein